MAIIALPALGASLYRVTTIGWQPIMFVHIFLAIGLITIALFRHRIVYTVRAAVTILILLTIGLGGLFQFGLVAASVPFLVVAGATSVMFFSGAAAAAVFAIILSGVAVIGLLTVTGILSISFDPKAYLTSPSSWLNSLVALALASAAIMVSLVKYNQHLINALYRARRNEVILQDHQANLEKTIADRTEKLKRSNEELEQYARVVSHDLKSPLSAISGYNQLLKLANSNHQHAENAHLIARISEGVYHMNLLIDNLLQYSRLDGNPKPLQTIDMNDILEKAMRLLVTEIDTSGAKITHDDLPNVIADETQLIRVMQNLIANAIRYRNRQRALHIHISAERLHDSCMFVVSDNGIGIKPDQLKKVFELFKKTDDNTNQEGLGIGLATCRKIIEHHGGKIWVESEPGQGSSFVFTLDTTDVDPQEIEKSVANS